MNKLVLLFLAAQIVTATLPANAKWVAYTDDGFTDQGDSYAWAPSPGDQKWVAYTDDGKSLAYTDDAGVAATSNGK